MKIMKKTKQSICALLCLGLTASSCSTAFASESISNITKTSLNTVNTRSGSYSYVDLG